MTLPAKRIIQTDTYGQYEQPDVTDEEAERIREAISCGRLIFWVASRGEEKYSSNHREIDLTYYRDPISGEPRYAVETWLGSRKWTYDFATSEAAREQVVEDRRMVSL